MMSNLKTSFWNYVAEREGDSYGSGGYSPTDIYEYADEYLEENHGSTDLRPETLYDEIGLSVVVTGDPGDPDIEVSFT